jgi:hypothetical protein
VARRAGTTLAAGACLGLAVVATVPANAVIATTGGPGAEVARASAVSAARAGTGTIGWTCRFAPAAAATRTVSGDALGSALVSATTPDRPATRLRETLGRLLGDHAFLLMEAMRATAGASADEPAITARLDQNSDALADAFSSVYGADARSTFRPLWQRHIDAATAFAVATAAGSTAGQNAARRQLDTFRKDFGDFLHAANPDLDPAAESQAIRLHVNQLIAFAQGDYASAYGAAREAYAHMFMLGDTLAQAIATQLPDRYPDVRAAFSPASELRLTLDRLLGEHLILAAEAMRSSLLNGPDVPAARLALDGNTTDLTSAIRSVYGGAAASFSDVWTAHVVAYLDYIDAVRAGDTARTAAARQSLQQYGQALGQFLATADPALDANAVATLMATHTASLLEMVDRYRTGDAAGAYGTVDDAYGHMFEVGDTLAAGIAAQFPDRYRDLAPLPATDTAAAPWRLPSPLWLSTLFATALTWLLLMAPRTARRFTGRGGERPSDPIVR